MGEVFAGRYELADPIGRGGVGAVWRAWDHRRRRYVAAKVLQQSDAHSLLRFVREQALRIDHPHVLAPASWAADDDKVLFTMELVAGGSLVNLVNDYGPLPPAFVCTLLDQLLSGLAAVHAEDVVHRDIKPANVLLEATGTARPHLRLSDFGIAMRLGEPRLTETDYVVGTPGYFAPEQMMGADPDFPADLFAVGLVALYLLEGAKPDAKALIEYFAAHGTPGPPKGIPEPLWQVVATLLQPDPHARFRTATGARKALASAAELLPEPGPDDELVEVFDQLGPLPEGFGPDGPLRRASGLDTGSGSGGLRAARGGGSGVSPSFGAGTGADQDHGAGGGSGGGTSSGMGASGGPGSTPGSPTPVPGRNIPPAPTSRPETGASSAQPGPGAVPLSRTDATPMPPHEPPSNSGVGAGPTAAPTGSVPQPPATGAVLPPPMPSTAPPPTGSGVGAAPGPGSGGGGGSGSGHASGPWHHGPGMGTGTDTGAGAGAGTVPGLGAASQEPAPHSPTPESTPIAVPPLPDRDPTPPQPSTMSDTGSFHLPPPHVLAAHAPTGQREQHTPHYPQPQQQPQPQPEQPPTPPTSVALPVPSPVHAPHGEPAHVPSPQPHQPLSPSQAPATAVQQHAYASTGSYTARTPQVPRRARRKSRRRPGPPAKVAVPVLLLALACFAVGFWALAQL
ncbi:protein kinase domain-containing protein [Streptomyces sp. NPDC002845]